MCLVISPIEVLHNFVDWITWAHNLEWGNWKHTNKHVLEPYKQLINNETSMLII